MLPERDIIEPVRRRLEELLRRSVTLEFSHSAREGPDAVLRAGPRRFIVEAKASARVAVVHAACERVRRLASESGPDAIPLVAVPHMGPSGRRACDLARVSFVDVEGNAHLEAPGLLIHVEGKRQRRPGPGRPSSVFAPRSSRVSRLLLLEPKRRWRQRDLAERTALGRGYISRIVARLVAEGLVEQEDNGLVHPRDPDLLLDAWRDEYDFRRHRIIAGHIAARSGEELVERLVDALVGSDTAYALTGLPAAAMLTSFARFRLAAVYLRSVPTEDLLERLGFDAQEPGANTWLTLPRDEGVFDGAATVEGRVCVSAVQTYLDLHAMPERASEAAAELRREQLSWR